MSEEITGKDGARMVLIPAGPFIFGASDERLLDFYEGNKKLVQRYRDEFLEFEEERDLTIDAFYIDIFPVTNKLYEKFRQSAGYKKASPYSKDSRFGDPEKPVVGLDWDDARAYAKWAGKQLPSEQQWEKAARGTDGRLFPWGNAYEPSRCNCAETGWSTTSPLGRFPEGVSPYGVHDMAGNVWEMTSGKWAEADAMRGGGYLTYLHFCRVTARWAADPEELNRGASWLGFRCVMPANK
jgi:formylglycine-generating enzyme required for sulfatase activity